MRHAFMQPPASAAKSYLYAVGKQGFGEFGFGDANNENMFPVQKPYAIIEFNSAQPQVTSVPYTAGETIYQGSSLATATATGTFVSFTAGGYYPLKYIPTMGTFSTTGGTVTGVTHTTTVTYPSGATLPAPVQPDIWKVLALRYQTTMAVKTDGTLWATGSNNYSQCGVPSGTYNSVFGFIRYGSATNWVACAPGDEFCAALDGNGDIWTIGDNAIAAQCHNGSNTGDVTTLYNTSTTSSVFHPRIVSISTGSTGGTMKPFELIYQGPSGTPTWAGRMLIADQTAGLLYYANESGTLTTGTVTGRTSGSTMNVTSTTKSTPVWKTLAVGHRYTMAIDANGYLFSWGNNGGDTECGRPANCSAWPYTNSAFAGYAPQSALSYLADSSQPDYCSNATQDVNCWPVTYPYQTGGTKYTNVFPGAYNCMALTTTGLMIGWGKNADYEMGATLGSYGSTPVHLIPCASGHSWINGDSGDYHTALIRDDGTLWMAGVNSHGQLGNSSTTTPTDYVQVPNPTGTGAYWVAVSCGYTHTLAIDNSGNLWGWGDNTTYQLGLSSTTATTTAPLLLDSTHKYTQVTCGQEGSLALATT